MLIAPRSVAEARAQIAQTESQLERIKSQAVIDAAIEVQQRELESLGQRHAEAIAKRQTLLAKAQRLLSVVAATAYSVERYELEGLNRNAEEYAETLGAQPAPLWLGWHSEGWRLFEHTPIGGILEYVRVGRQKESDLIIGETGINDVPSTVPLLAAKGAVLILCDTACNKIARSLIQTILLRAALAIPGESQFTLIDPMGLGAAFPFRGQFARVRPSGRSVADELADVLDDIKRINEAVVGHEDRFLDLSPEKRAGEAFEFVAAVDFPEAYAKDHRAIDCLIKLANSGPRAGKHLILEVWADKDLPRDVTMEQFGAAVVLDCRHLNFIPDELPDGTVQRRRLEAAAKAGAKTSGGDWRTLVRPPRLYSENSIRRVETPTGERLRFWFGREDDGRPCAHAMLAGQVGSGKSYLLHVLITGLAARYGPGELRFVLVDGKQGVEFEAYRTLPHADVVCLRTSPAIARSVLADYVAEMNDRWEKFQRVNVVELEEYRLKTGQELPRMLMIVDEYQQILEGDPEQGVRLLRPILEKGRAAGTHIVLASQFFLVEGLPASATQNIHLRASLSLAQDYLQGLQVFGPEGKRLIRELAPSGQVVVNDQSGADGQNMRGAVARLKSDGADRELTHIVEELRIAAGPTASSPIVLSGREGVVLADNPTILEFRREPPDPLVLQERARRSVRTGGFGIETWNAADRPIPLWLGRKFDVRGHTVVPLRRAPNQHLLVLGPHTPFRVAMLANALAGLRAMMHASALEVLVLDGLGQGMPGAGLLDVSLAVLVAAGASVQRVQAADLAVALSDLAKTVRSQDNRGDERARLLVLNEPDYLPALHVAASGFGAPTSGPPADLRFLLQQGPQIGCHVILNASSMGAVSAILHPTRETRLFNHRVVQQLNEDDSMTLFAALAASRINEQADHPMAAMYVDMIQGIRRASLFRSYGVDRDVFAPITEASLGAALHQLFG